MWYEITYPCPNLKGYAVKFGNGSVTLWHFSGHVITYLCSDKSNHVSTTCSRNYGFNDMSISLLIWHKKRMNFLILCIMITYGEHSFISLGINAPDIVIVNASHLKGFQRVVWTSANMFHTAFTDNPENRYKISAILIKTQTTFTYGLMKYIGNDTRLNKLNWFLSQLAGENG